MSERKTRLPKGITQRPDGRYMWRFQYEGEKYTGYAWKLSEARKALNDKRYEVEHGMYIKEDVITLEDWYKAWMASYKEPALKDGTAYDYQKIYQKHIAPEFGKRKLKNIRPEQLQKYFNDLSLGDLGSGTIGNIYKVFSGMTKQAYMLGKISQDPFERVERPAAKDDVEHHRELTREEQDAFAAAAADDFFFPAFRLAMCTGMRVGEIFGLEWEDVDEAHGMIHVRHTLRYVKGKGYFLETPKTRNSQREIPITEQAAAILKEQKREQLTTRLKLGPAWKETDFADLVFTGQLGGPVPTMTVDRHLKKISEKMVQAGSVEEPFTFHTFRTTFATRAIEAGMNPKTLQVIMGHSSINITMNIYARVMENTKKNEMRMIASSIDLSGRVSDKEQIKEG